MRLLNQIWYAIGQLVDHSDCFAGSINYFAFTVTNMSKSLHLEIANVDAYRGLTGLLEFGLLAFLSVFCSKIAPTLPAVAKLFSNNTVAS